MKIHRRGHAFFKLERFYQNCFTDSRALRFVIKREREREIGWWKLWNFKWISFFFFFVYWRYCFMTFSSGKRWSFELKNKSRSWKVRGKLFDYYMLFVKAISNILSSIIRFLFKESINRFLQKIYNIENRIIRFLNLNISK